MGKEFQRDEEATLIRCRRRLLCAALTTACALPACGGEPQEPATTNARDLICGQVGMFVTERYYTDVMDRKLQQYPELSERTGLTSVRTCDDARLLTSTAREILPEQQRGYVEDREEVAEVSPAASGTLSKIRNGLDSDARAVVSFVSAGLGCSGFMIREDVMLTAAHCLPAAASTSETPGSIAITFTTESVNEAKVTTAENVDAWRHEDYEGGAEDGEDDIGMVRFSRDVAEGLIRIGLGPIRTAAPQSEFEIHGWGTNDPSSCTGFGTLRQGDQGNHVFVAEVPNIYSFAAEVKNAEEPAATCLGDSGGPAVRASGGEPLAMGVWALFSYFAPVAPCCAANGDIMEWTRLSEKIGWIENRIGSCDRGGSGDTAHARCFD